MDMEIVLKKLEYQPENNSSVVVLGDSILDKYIFGETRDRNFTLFIPHKKFYYLGGASNVANNIIKLGANSLYLSVFGESERAKTFHTLLNGKGLGNSIIIKDKEKEISLKTRLVSDNRVNVRIDEDNNTKINDQAAGQLYAQLRYCISVNPVPVIILSDSCLGSITNELYTSIKKLCELKKIKLFLDCSLKYDFSGIFLFKPNLSEFEKITGQDFISIADLVPAAVEFKTQNGIENLLITMDKGGLLFVDKENQWQHIKSLSSNPVDTCGAGDTMLAALAVCTLNGIPMKSAIEFANYAAAVCCSNMGTYAVALNEVQSFWKGACYE